MRLFAELRTRERLTPGEVDTLIEAAKKGQHDATAILVAFRHGAPSGRVVRPALGSGGFWGCCAPCEADQERDPSTHSLQADELRALRHLQRKQVAIAYVFVSGRGAVPFTTAGFTGWWSARRAAVSVL